nr:MAG TPA: hypothetical protein [Caudoviricetes sp.]
MSGKSGKTRIALEKTRLTTDCQYGRQSLTYTAF